MGKRGVIFIKDTRRENLFSVYNTNFNIAINSARKLDTPFDMVLPKDSPAKWDSAMRRNWLRENKEAFKKELEKRRHSDRKALGNFQLKKRLERTDTWSIETRFYYEYDLRTDKGGESGKKVHVEAWPVAVPPITAGTKNQ